MEMPKTVSLYQSFHPITKVRWRTARYEDIRQAGKPSAHFRFTGTTYLSLFFRFSAGDEILAVNGTPLQGLTHQQAISVFKEIKNGSILLHVGRRDNLHKA